MKESKTYTACWLNLGAKANYDHIIIELYLIYIIRVLVFEGFIKNQNAMEWNENEFIKNQNAMKWNENMMYFYYHYISFTFFFFFAFFNN